jgi:hypothetical protein
MFVLYQTQILFLFTTINHQFQVLKSAVKTNTNSEYKLPWLTIFYTINCYYIDIYYSKKEYECRNWIKSIIRWQNEVSLKRKNVQKCYQPWISTRLTQIYSKPHFSAYSSFSRKGCRLMKSSCCLECLTLPNSEPNGWLSWNLIQTLYPWKTPQPHEF